MNILSLGEKPKGLVMFFRGDIPEEYESEFNLADTISGYITTEDTSLRELCERNGYLKTALENHVRDSVNDPDHHPLRGEKRETIKNRYKCADSDFFDEEIVGALIDDGVIVEKNGRLFSKITRRGVKKELLPKLLANSEKDARKVLDQLDKQQTWKDKGREIIGEMEERGSLVNIEGELLPFFLRDEILNIEYVDGKIKWSIQEDDRWGYWRNIFEEIEISIGEFEFSRGSGFGEIDYSEISPGRYNLTASFTYVVKEEDEGVLTREKAELTEKKIVVPPKFKIYSSPKIDEQILEIDTDPKVLERIDLEMLELTDNAPIVLSDIKWVQQGGNSYTKIGEEPAFSLGGDGKDLSNWSEEHSLRNFLEDFLEICTREADAPSQNCECKIEADSPILELFDKDLGEMLELYVNGEKVGIEEKSEGRCFSAWEAKQREYRVQAKIDFEKDSLALKEKILRIPFPEPKIELVEVS